MPDVGTGNAAPGTPAEPLLRLQNIQGNGIVGFNKPFQTLLFFQIDNAEQFKHAVADLGHRVATADKVLEFNRRFKKAAKDDRPTATWMNVAFSYAGLAILRPNDVVKFHDRLFNLGMASSETLEDPRGSRWKVTDSNGHLMVIVAADLDEDRQTEVDNVRKLIRKRGGASEVRCEEGQVLRGSTGAIEHFGFRDGVSQPGVAGRASADRTDLLTPLPCHPDHKPGQERVWPGEFVFGYPDHDWSNNPAWNGMPPDYFLRGVPEWARDGSYLVFRRLRQDVHAFHTFLQKKASCEGGTAAAAGAKVVGRWASGVPIVQAPTKDDTDDPELAKSNDFVFQGSVCPGNAHIRKVNPRDDCHNGHPVDSPRHRMLRRAIPFGPPSKSTPESPKEDNEERGLLFLAYMTSIVDQFEWVTKEWANNNDFHEPEVGPDALLGKPWIELTGGGYYFAPSVCALMKELST